MSEFKVMANTPEQNRKYLRGYLEGDIKQKIRLEAAIQLYVEQYDVLTENVVDQAEVVRSMKAGLTPADLAANPDLAQSILQAEDRLTRLQKMKIEVNNALTNLKVRNAQMIRDGQAHMVELSEIEIDQGGFVALMFGLREGVEYDEKSQKLIFKPGGSAETIIGTKLISWKDSSQLSITKITR